MSAPAGPGELRVAVVGAGGRMGRFATGLLEEAPGFAVVARIGREDELEDALRSSGAELALDLTAAGRGFDHGRAMLGAGLRPVIGTSGVSPEENAELDRLARERGLGGLVVPNFSLGMVLVQRAAVDAARRLSRVEILELHHEGKLDAPSGTALDTAERIAAALGRDAASIPIHSVRLPGLYAHQEVLLGGPGELVTLRHDASGPEAFGPGLLLALRHAARCEGVGRGLETVLTEDGGAGQGPPTRRRGGG